ncbi:hypothetical protein B5G22_11440 [Limosilactobacillus reuteri]|uniref:Uncharacterized protein n=2 Tax=Limosilactobacillus reuteri TaxID=1598 RepID=A0A1Y4NRL8_LIMRT|nr:hypothetical protein B5G22_11440 [Limosilactobacillus reuteri]OUP82771.1 hypothetical protein B5F04_11270 [Limosilactobacillus reuteri]
MWFTENKRQSDRRLLMKKILAINHEFVARSYILFPMLLFAFSIIANANIITFVWSFIFVYTVEKVMPFILDGRLNLASWSGVTKFCSVIAFIGGNPCFYWNLFSL